MFQTTNQIGFRLRDIPKQRDFKQFQIFLGDLRGRNLLDISENGGSPSHPGCFHTEMV